MPEAENISLVGGALALDFANTAGGRGTEYFTEYLTSPTDLVAWARHAGAVDAATAERLRAEVDATVLRHAQQLREAVYGVGSALASGGVGPAADLKTLKEFAAKTAVPAELAPRSGGTYGLDFSAAPVESALLGPIAWSALNVLSAGSFERLKQCPGHDCGWLFIDTSKNNSRRWCDMATCGNRTKGRRHRQRQ